MCGCVARGRAASHRARLERLIVCGLLQARRGEPVAAAHCTRMGEHFWVQTRVRRLASDPSVFCAVFDCVEPSWGGASIRPFWGCASREQSER
jgi:hypothetical protein